MTRAAKILESIAYLRAQIDKELPPPAGSQSIRSGYVRLYHQTSADALPSILREGLKSSYARNNYERAVFADRDGFYGAPGKDYPTIEFAVPEDWFHGTVVNQDVPPSYFIAVHMPWHGKVRYIEKNASALKATLAGQNDFITDADYAPAIAYIKRKHG